MSCAAPQHPGAQPMMVNPGNLWREYKLFIYCDDMVVRETYC